MKMNPAHQQGSSKAFTIIFWLLLMGSLTLFFNGFIEQKYNPNRHLVEMEAGLGTDVVLLRNQAGHYVAPGFINGHEVTFCWIPEQPISVCRQELPERRA